VKVHLVVAHPEQDSFNFALHKTAVEVLEKENFKLTISDLYKQNKTSTLLQGEMIRLTFQPTIYSN